MNMYIYIIRKNKKDIFIVGIYKNAKYKIKLTTIYEALFFHVILEKVCQVYKKIPTDIFISIELN